MSLLGSWHHIVLHSVIWLSHKVQKSILYRCGGKNSEINFFNFCEIFDLTPLLLNSLYLSTPSADFKIVCFVLCRNEFWTTLPLMLRKIKQNKKTFSICFWQKSIFLGVPPIQLVSRSPLNFFQKTERIVSGWGGYWARRSKNFVSSPHRDWDFAS